MSFFLQHGYGKSQKIQTLEQSGYLGGVILSAADEDPATLYSTSEACDSLDLSVLVDPQSFIYTTAPKGRGKHHDAHGVRFVDLHWSQDARATAAQVSAVGSLNQRVNPLGSWIAPSVLQSSFTDVWTPVAMQLARTASDSWGPKKTLAPLVIDESALSTWSSIDDWLDVATTLDVKGFYLLVARSNSTYPPVAWSAERLSNLLRLIYNLSELNNYDVVWGYSDAEGILGQSVGATTIASGWNYTLRQFNPTKWQPSDSKGGRAPVARYDVARLWAPLRAETEAATLFRSNLRDQIFTKPQIAKVVRSPLTEMTRSDAVEHHLELLARRSSLLDPLSIPQRLDKLQSSLQRAIDLYAQIERERIILESRYRPRVESLIEAISRFRKAEGV